MQRLKIPVVILSLLVLPSCGDPFIATSGSASAADVPVTIDDCAKFPSRC